MNFSCWHRYQKGSISALSAAYSSCSSRPKIMYFAAFLISGSASAFTTISGPIPAGSPIVMAITGCFAMELLNMLVVILF